MPLDNLPWKLTMSGSRQIISASLLPPRPVRMSMSFTWNKSLTEATQSSRQSSWSKLMLNYFSMAFIINNEYECLLDVHTISSKIYLIDLKNSFRYGLKQMYNFKLFSRSIEQFVTGMSCWYKVENFKSLSSGKTNESCFLTVFLNLIWRLLMSLCFYVPTFSFLSTTSLNWS